MTEKEIIMDYYAELLVLTERTKHELQTTQEAAVDLEVRYLVYKDKLKEVSDHIMQTAAKEFKNANL